MPVELPKNESSWADKPTLKKASWWTKQSLFFLSLALGLILASAPLMIISLAFLSLLLLEIRLKINIPSNLATLFILFILASVVLGSYFDYYERYLWLDDLLHGFYGAAFALIGFIVIQYLSEARGITNDILIVCLFSFCFSVAFGALWEIYEYTYDVLMQGNMQRTDQGRGVDDTMHDIIIETSAAFVVNIFIYFYLKTGADNWVSRVTKDFIAANPVRGKALWPRQKREDSSH